MTAVVSARDLVRHYAGDGAVVRALDGVSLEVAAGEFLAIMGASGSGKSTVLHLLGGLDRPSSGDVVIAGNEITTMDDCSVTIFRRRRLGIIFQSYNLLPTLTALENVMLPAILDGANAGRAKTRATELLERVDLVRRASHRPGAMSGGEQQRVAVARALMNDPVLILADEPTGNLDSRHGREVWQLLASLVRDEQRTVVAVTHESHGAAHADRVLVLRDGRAVGELRPDGESHASMVAARYAELAG